MSNDFWFTRAGMRLAEATMPKIADQLQALNANIEALVAEMKLQREAKEKAKPEPK